MRITTRLLILFVAITIAFAGYFYLFIHIKNTEDKVFQEADLYQRRQTLGAVFNIRKDTQKGIVSDYRIREDMLDFINTGDAAWARQHLQPLLDAYDFDLVQVYDRYGRIIYGNYDAAMPGLEEFRLEKTQIDSLKSHQTIDYLVKYRQYLLSVMGGTIHSRTDSLGTNTNGILVIATRWDSAYFQSIAASLSYKVSFSSVEPQKTDEDMKQYNIKILHPLVNWEGEEIAWLTFYISNPYLKEMQELGKRVIFVTGAFILLFLFIHFLLIEQWISIPLNQISRSLKENKLEPIHLLSERNNEFADVANLIEQFFHQKQNLLHEIDDRKRTEAKLREAEQQTLSIFLTSPESIVVTDIECRVLTANDETSRLFQLPPTRHPGTIFDFVNEEDTPQLKAMVQDLIAGASVRNQEIQVLNSVGEAFPALISASVIFNARQEPSRLIFITRDLSQLKALEDRLLQAQKMESLGTLAGGIAHDFNNIMTIIAGYIAMSAAKMDGNCNAQNDLDEALKACLRAKSLINKILTFSRHTEPNVQTVVLGDVLTDTLPMIRASLPTSIEIITDINSNRYCLADPTELQQVLINLASNAYFAMRKTGGVLSFTIDEIPGFELIGIDQTVQLGEDYLHLIVSDTGMGIAPDYFKRIFDPYFSTKGMGEGTGLGLSIVHGIVSKSNGFISVQSVLEEGSSFHIYLLIVDQSPPLNPQTQRQTSSPRSARVLFIDDEIALTELFGEALARYGHEVTIYSDSLEALNNFLSDPEAYDLVIADITMPNLDGFKLAARIRETSGIPIILYTGYSVYNLQEESNEVNVNRILSKPLLPDELQQVIQEVLEESRMASEEDLRFKI